MKILVYGAGVVGQAYAAQLQMAKCNVTLLARGQRCADLRDRGIMLKEALSGRQLNIHVPIVEQFEPTDVYDLVLVTVRMDQVEEVLPILAANSQVPSVMFMLNNPGSTTHLMELIGTERVLLGFPGIGGTRQGDVVHYVMVNQQPTTIGEVHGKITPRLQQIAAILKKTGFPVEICTNMEAWLKTHAVFITCVSAAIMMEGGDSIRLGRTRESVLMMIEAIREGFAVLHVLGIPITPSNLETIFKRMPSWFGVLYWQRALQTTLGTLAIAPHAKAARTEMKALATEVLTMADSTSIQIPTLKHLLSFI